MGICRRCVPFVLFGTAMVFTLPATLLASPQSAASVPATSLDDIKDRLLQPSAPRLTPSHRVELRPTFKSQVERHPYVLTLEEQLHKDFDMNALQRQSAEWRAKCCGLNLLTIFKAIDNAQYDGRVRRAREQVRRELADLEAARAAQPPAR